MKGHHSDWDSTVSLDQLGTCMIHFGFQTPKANGHGNMHICMVCTLQVTRERPVRPDRLRGPVGASIRVQRPSKIHQPVNAQPCCCPCFCWFCCRLFAAHHVAIAAVAIHVVDWWYLCCRYSFAAHHVDGAVAAIQLVGIFSFPCKQPSQTVYSNLRAVWISKFLAPRLALTRNVANTLTGLYLFSSGIFFKQSDYLFDYP